MFCSRQLFVTLLVATIVFGCLLFVTGPSLATWASLTGLLIVGASITLCFSVPKSVLDLQRGNCIRRDGSWSWGRQNVEASKQLNLFQNIAFGLTIVVIPTLFGLWLVNHEIAPLGVGLRFAVDKFNAPADQQPRVNAMAKVRYDGWYGELDTGDITKRESHYQWLRQDSPLLVLAGCIWLFACAVFLGKYYIYSIQQLRNSAISRGEAYYWRDLGNETDVMSKRKKTKRKREPAAAHPEVG